jgi:DNA-binding LacI/PurR family transcriptional regulator
LRAHQLRVNLRTVAREAPDPVSPVGRTGRHRRPTAADVAQRAGFSRATVSYVLNNTPHQVIPEVTRQRVLAAADELGYSPSPAARALAGSRSNVVLLLLPEWPIEPAVGRLLADLSTTLADRGLTLVVHPYSAVRPLSEIWKAITPAAVVTFEELDQIETQKLVAAGVELAVALIGGRRGPHALDIPEQRAGLLQAEYLAAAGHRQLGYAWPDDERVTAFAHARLEGVRQTCADLGLPQPRVLTVPLTPQGAAAAVQAWRQAEPSVSGICAYNDDVALAVIAGARQQGCGIPRDLAVIGVDNIPAAAVASPPLTTVEPDLQAISRYIADTIVRKLSGRPSPRQPRSDTHFVISRDSA